MLKRFTSKRKLAISLTLIGFVFGSLLGGAFLGGFFTQWGLARNLQDNQVSIAETSVIVDDLQCYQIWPPASPIVNRDVIVSDPFNPDGKEFKVIKPELFCVETKQKNSTSSSVPGDDGRDITVILKVDFVCYQIWPLNPQQAIVDQVVKVTDQFSDGRQVKVIKPIMLCESVEQEPAGDPGTPGSAEALFIDLIPVRPFAYPFAGPSLPGDVNESFCDEENNRVQVFVRNIGNSTAGSSRVGITFVDGSGFGVLDNTVIDELQAGEEAVVDEDGLGIIFEPPDDCPGCFFSIIVDELDEVNELDEDNNLVESVCVF